MDGSNRLLHSVEVGPSLGATGTSRGGGWLITAAKCLLGIAIVAWLCAGRLELRRLAEVSLSPSLGLLVALLFASLLLPAIRWWWLLRIQEIDASPWQAIKLTWAGYIAGVILPGAVGGDLAKSYLVVRKHPSQRARSFSTVIVDRLIGVYSLVLLGSISASVFLRSGSLSSTGQALAWSVVSLLAGTTLSMALALVGPWQKSAARFVPVAWSRAWRDSQQLYWQSKRALIGCLGLSLLSSVLTVVSFAAADRVLDGQVAWSASLLVGPLVVLANSLPITPGGIGVAEATASELFGQFGSANGAEMMLIVRMLMVVMAMPALLALLGSKRNRIRSTPNLGPLREDPPSAASTRQELPKAA
jgi:hypothetical protein